MEGGDTKNGGNRGERGRGDKDKALKHAENKEQT
jgi:hypothetical protein